MRSIFTIVLLALSSFQYCLAQYSWKALPTAPHSWRFDDMYFLTPQKGWAINPYYNYLTPNQFGRVFTTDDGGQTWVKLIDTSFTFYRSIGFADSVHGWIGNLGQYTPDTNFMYQTADGGISWQPVTNVTGPRPKGICGISVVNDSVVYAYGRYFGPAIVMKTTNRGLSWISQDLSGLATGLVDGYFVNADTGFITGSYDTSQKALILSTYDGGASWQVRHQSARSHEIVWKVVFPSRLTGYATIESGLGLPTPLKSDTTRFLKTVDGGLNWQEHLFKTNGYFNLQGLGFINDSTGWIGGDASVAANYITRNGGLTWSVDTTFGVQAPPYTHFGGYSVNRFRRFGDTLMYAGGNTIYKYGKTPTSVVSVQNDIATVNVYPNPFSDYLEVKFIAHANVSQPIFSVYNSIGQQIIKGQPVRQGINRYSLPLLNSGVYYFQISDRNKILASGKLECQ